MRVISYTGNGLNAGPKRCVPPEHVNRTISGKRVSVYVVKDLEVRSSWVRVALNPIERVLVRDKRGETQTQRRSHVKTEAEMGGMQPRAWGRLEPPEAGKGSKNPILEPLERLPSSNILISDVWSPGLGEDEFLLF